MIHAQYRKAGELSDHYCPGLAVGVRTAAKAWKIPAADDIKSQSL